jgi:DNA-binding NarL/FixJ family response regulator
MARSVLLIDDNPLFLRILARFLADYGEGAVQVVGSVVGGRGALAMAGELRPDVVLLDLRMPDVSGLELLPRLRSLLPTARLVAVSLMDPDSSRPAALAAGADAFVEKMHLERDLLPALRLPASRELRPSVTGEG